MNDVDKMLLQQISDHLRYLKGKDLALFKQEIEMAVHHYPVNKKVNYDVSKFKHPIHEVLH